MKMILKLHAKRVVNTLKYWIDNFFEDFEDNPEMLQKLNVLLEYYANHPTCHSMVEMLSALVKRKVLHFPVSVRSCFF